MARMRDVDDAAWVGGERQEDQDRPSCLRNLSIFSGIRSVASTAKTGPYIGTRPSRKSVKSLLRRIHQRTTRQWYADDPNSTVARISSMLRGWCGYFDQGPVHHDLRPHPQIHRATRSRRWLLRRSGRKGTGFDQIPDEYLYETLGLYTVPAKPQRPAKSEDLMGREKAGCGKSARPV